MTQLYGRQNAEILCTDINREPNRGKFNVTKITGVRTFFRLKFCSQDIIINMLMTLFTSSSLFRPCWLDDRALCT